MANITPPGAREYPAEGTRVLRRGTATNQRTECLFLISLDTFLLHYLKQ